MLVPAVTAVALVPASPAAGAVITGPYAGVSHAKVITKYGQLTPAVQKGKVAFRVRANRITGFTLRKQRAQCPGTPGAVVVDVTIPTMRLSAAGIATGPFTHPNFGPGTVRVKVNAKGRATGTVRFPASCRTTATFVAARR